MRLEARHWFLGSVFVALTVGLPVFWLVGESTQPAGSAYARLGNVAKVEEAYASWVEATAASAADKTVEVALGWAKGISVENLEAGGLARLDYGRSRVEVEVAGLPADRGFDAWLLDNQEGAGRSAAPEAGDVFHRLGRLIPTGQTARLEARLSAQALGHFEVDSVVVAAAGQRPEDAVVLLGSPSLFQRIYAGQVRPVTAAARPAFGNGPFAGGFLGIAPAHADSPFNSLDPLIAQGADLFFNEEFAGNGRVCATCHPAENNFTIDPRFIARLPAHDPLFVAETNPNLAVNFEKPALLRSLGLVLENVDGFEDLNTKFVMRGVQHLQGLSRYLVPGNGSVPPNQRTGWGGDGAPGSGTLRDFATGAVIQHYTQSLARTPGVDFRLPTDAELDALEAFMLALGRQDNPVLASLTMPDPVIERGRVLFLSSQSRCNNCHFNGGANFNLAPFNLNVNFDIGVNKLPDHPADLILPGNLPPDGGFGRTAVFDPVSGAFLGFGFNGQTRFNIQPAIEAVDTAPFFHNNAVQTIEEAVDFYNSTAFNTSPTGTIALETTQVEAIAAFLRVMNALENIRASIALDEAAIAEPDRDTAKRLADLASYDTEDGFQVLDERFLVPAAITKLKLAYAKERLAAHANGAPVRNALLQGAITLKEQARDALVIEP